MTVPGGPRNLRQPPTLHPLCHSAKTHSAEELAETKESEDVSAESESVDQQSEPSRSRPTMRSSREGKLRRRFESKEGLLSAQLNQQLEKGLARQTQALRTRIRLASMAHVRQSIRQFMSAAGGQVPAYAYAGTNFATTPMEVMKGPAFANLAAVRAFQQTFPALFAAIQHAPPGFAQPLSMSMAQAYTDWAQNFSPLMSLAQADNFVRQLVQAELESSPLVRQLSQGFHGRLEQSIRSLEHAVQGQTRAFEKFMADVQTHMSSSALGRQLSKRFKRDPMAFKPFQRLSAATLSDIRRRLDGISGQVKRLLPRTNRNLRRSMQIANQAATQQIARELKTAVSQGRISIEDAVRTLDQLPRQLGQELDKFRHDAEGALQTVREFPDQLNKDLDRFRTDARNAIQTVREFPDQVGQEFDRFRNDAEKAIRTVRDLPEQFGREFDRFRNDAENAIQSVRDFPERIGDEFNKFRTNAENAVRGVTQDVENALDDPIGTVRNALPTNVTVAEGRAEARASVLSASGSFGRPGGPVHGAGSVAVLEAGASASGKVSANLRDLQLRAEGKVSANVDLARAEGHIEVGAGAYLGARGWGQARAGADAEAEGSIGFDPSRGEIAAELGGDVFAGARAQGRIGGTLGPVTASAQAGVQAGIGANFSAHAGLKDGKLSVGVDIGAALGIGIRLKLDLSLNFKPIIDVVKKGWNAAKDFVLGAGKKIGEFVGSLKKGVEKAVGWIGNGAKNVGKALGDAAKTVGKGIGDAAKAVGKGIGKAAKSIGKGIKKIFKGW